MLDSFGFEVLRRDQCLELLAGLDVGRVIFTHRGLPAVQPVRYISHGEEVLCCAPEVSALFHAAGDAVVAFEVDDFAADRESGWFVTVLGRARLQGAEGVPESLPAMSWRSVGDDRYLCIPIEVVSGRRRK